MTQGRSIRLFLVDGIPNGLLTAEIMNWTGVDGRYQNLYQQLCDDGVLIETEQGVNRFVFDYAFSSPSAAAAVVSGRSANGRTSWKVE